MSSRVLCVQSRSHSPQRFFSVQRPNYYQFHAGIYFDLSIGALTKWTSPSLRVMSITQDPQAQQMRTGFAQPLVFFNFQPFLDLSISRTACNITSLRLRVPGRDVTAFLAAAPNAFPSLARLGLSTGSVRGGQLNKVLSRFDRLEHLALDNCPFLSYRDPEDWVSLGRECALVGVQKAKAREKAIKAWWANNAPVITEGNVGQQAGAPRKAKSGRKGLAAATISIRGANAPSVPVAGPSVASSAEDSTAEEEALLEALQRNLSIRVAPRPTKLRTLTLSAPTPIEAEQDADDSDDNTNDSLEVYREKFTEGWNSGIATLGAIWARMKALNAGRSIVVRLTLGAGPEMPGPKGLRRIEEEYWAELEQGSYPAPSLCFAGLKAIGHAENCGHRATVHRWHDKDFLDM